MTARPRVLAPTRIIVYNNRESEIREARVTLIIDEDVLLGLRQHHDN